VGDELQSEFFVPLAHLDQVWPELVAGSTGFADALHVMEIRSVAGDELWMSPFHDRQTLAIHATWSSDLAATLPALRALETLLAPYDPIPHWGKVFTAWDPLDLGRMYPDAARFEQLAERLDPDRCFVNGYLGRLGVRQAP
jgi:xylitol oxidase